MADYLESITSAITIMINTLRPRQNDCFADNIFKHIFLNENIGISSKISLKFVSHGPINNNPSLIQQSGTKPNLVAKILATKFGDRLALATKIGSQH